MGNLFVRILPLFLLATIAEVKAQWIEQYSLAVDFELYGNIYSQDNSKHLDYLNYINNSEDYLIDGGNFNIYADFWHKNDWQSAVQLDLVPFTFELKATKNYKNLGINMGFGREAFFLYEMEDYFESLSRTYRLEGYYIQDYLYLTGPFGGLKYAYLGERINLIADLNLGLQWNNKIDKTVILKERNSNYVEKVIYETKRSLGLSIAPSLKFNWSIIKAKSFECGPFLRYKYFYTYRKLNYNQTLMEWTADNPIKTTPEQQAHHIQRHGFHFGLFVLIK